MAQDWSLLQEFTELSQWSVMFLWLLNRLICSRHIPRVFPLLVRPSPWQASIRPLRRISIWLSWMSTDLLFLCSCSWCLRTYEQVGVRMTQHDVENLVREVDTQGKGQISFEQFRKLFADSASGSSWSLRWSNLVGLQMRNIQSHECKCCVLKNSLGLMCNCMRGLGICAVDRDPLKERSLKAFWEERVPWSSVIQSLFGCKICTLYAVPNRSSWKALKQEESEMPQLKSGLPCYSQDYHLLHERSYKKITSFLAKPWRILSVCMTNGPVISWWSCRVLHLCRV